MTTYHYDSTHRFPRDPRLIVLTAAVMIITLMMPLLSHGQTIAEGDTATTTPSTTMHTAMMNANMTTTGTHSIAYKHLGMANLSGSELSPRVMTNATGQLMLNVHPNEDRIDYTLSVRNGDAVTAAHLHCAAPGATGPIIAQFYTTNNAQNVNGVIAAGTISTSDLKSEAAACNPNITTIPHLVQAIRDGKVYAIVDSANNQNGLLRGQVFFPGFTPHMRMMAHTQTSTVLSSSDLTITELHNGTTNSRTFMITISNRLIDQIVAAANELARRIDGDLENRIRDWLEEMNIRI